MMTTTTKATTECWKCSGTGTYLHFGTCFACHGTGRTRVQHSKPQTKCTCSPETWCFLPGHNFWQAFPDQSA